MNITTTMTAPFMGMPVVEGFITATGRNFAGPLTETISRFGMTSSDYRREHTRVWGEPRSPICYVMDGNDVAAAGAKSVQGPQSTPPAVKDIPLSHALRQISLLTRSFDDGVWAPPTQAFLSIRTWPPYSCRSDAYFLATRGLKAMLKKLLPAISHETTKQGLTKLILELDDTFELAKMRYSTTDSFVQAKNLARTLNKAGEDLLILSRALIDHPERISVTRILQAAAEFIRLCSDRWGNGDISDWAVRAQKASDWAHLAAKLLKNLDVVQYLTTVQAKDFDKIVRELSVVYTGTQTGAWNVNYFIYWVALNSTKMDERAQILHRIADELEKMEKEDKPESINPSA